MRHWEKQAFGWLTVISALSGVGYFLMKHLWVSDDPFAVEVHPLQAWSLVVHILVAPALVLAAGILYATHVRPYLSVAGRSNRRSGMLMLGTFGVMVLSGYGLQVLAAPWARDLSLVAHLAGSVLFVGAFASHVVVSRFLRRRRRPGAEPASCPELEREAA